MSTKYTSLPWSLASSLSAVALLLFISTGGNSTANRGPLPSPTQTYKFYFGNLHSHTKYSDGSGTPVEAYRHARDVADLDFLAITEHNHKAAESSAGERKDGLLIATKPSLYKELKDAADNIDDSGKFVAIYGQEFSSISSGNHSNVFMAKKVITTDNGDYPTVFTDQWMDEYGVEVIQLNHPWELRRKVKKQDGSTTEVQTQPSDLGTPHDNNYGRKRFGSNEDFLEAVDGRASLIEVINGPALTRGNPNKPIRVADKRPGYYISYLNMGLHLAPTANQDNHYETWGTITEARTVVLAPSLTRSEVLKALKERRVYASEDKDLKIDMTINGAVMGSRLSPVASGKTVPVRIVIRDEDDPNSSYEVKLYYDDVVGGQNARIIDTGTVQDGDTLKFDPKPKQGRGYYFIEVTGMSASNKGYKAWTAPVWFE